MKIILFVILFSCSAFADCEHEWYAKQQKDGTFSLIKKTDGIKIPLDFLPMELDDQCNPWRVIGAMKLDKDKYVIDQSLLSASRADWDAKDKSGFVMP